MNLLQRTSFMTYQNYVKTDKDYKKYIYSLNFYTLKHINHTQHIAIIERAKNKMIKHKTQIGKTFSSWVSTRQTITKQ